MLFNLGRGIGIIGRVLLSLFVVSALIAAVVHQNTILFSLLLGYVIFAVIVTTELLSAGLMTGANWIAYRAHKKMAEKTR